MARNYSFTTSLVLLIFHFFAASSAKPARNISTDESVLLCIRSHLNLNPSHRLSQNWSDHSNVCSWIGVACGTRRRRVIALDISNMGLTGNLPSQLGNLSFLVALNLSRNSFHGSVPRELTRLRRLRMMDLAYNNLTGAMPAPTLFNFSSMERIYLTGNGFSGDLEYDICDGVPKLEGLFLSGNLISGTLSANLSRCTKLQVLSLNHNMFSGRIPREIGLLSRLEILDLGENRFTGSIPEELGNNTNLKLLNMEKNLLVDSIPPRIFNISSLQLINIAWNGLSGILPNELCSHLQQVKKIYLFENDLQGLIPSNLHECSALESLALSHNSFLGSIPKEIGNSSSLKFLYLTNNSLTGPIPQELGNLKNLVEFELLGNRVNGSIPSNLLNISTLRVLSLSQNQLTGFIASDIGYRLPNLECLEFGMNNLTSESHELSFITSLTNCRYLESFDAGENPLNGILPSSVGNLSTHLKRFYAFNCDLRGRIPQEIGNLSSLLVLRLFGNHLTGSLPKNLANFQSLQGLFLSRNSISGPISSTLCELRNLNGLELRSNQLNEAIPDCIGNVTTLRYLHLDSNQLSSTLPTSLWLLQDLLELNLSSNFLTGPLLPTIGNLRTASVVDLSMNQLSGLIPSTIESLQQVSIFSLADNKFEGLIPMSIGSMLNLEFLDLSHNNLSGSIPLSLQKLQHLRYFDVSFNDLIGEIPNDGPFKNFTSRSFLFNKGLCGDPRFRVPPCHHKKRSALRIVLISLAITSVFAFVMIIILGYLSQRNRNKERGLPNRPQSLPVKTPFRISYHELIEATNGYVESNFLGSGSFGTVYRGTLKDGTNVAIKIFNSKSEGGFKSFEVECEVLRNLRHNNLCKVIGSCSNQDFKALILEYMPNGSLEKRLYSDSMFLDLIHRISIMIDVACALEYLHHDCPIPIVHCDLKPSNILLDEHMVAHLCDFGIAKLLGDGESTIQTMTIATLGYIAPEFGLNGLVSTRSDIYSYGILLMEVFTRMKPSDESFGQDMSLRSWVKDSMPNGIAHIVESNLVSPKDDQCFGEELNCLSSIMELALNCSMESPQDRISIKDANVALKKIKNQLLAC